MNGNTASHPLSRRQIVAAGGIALFAGLGCVAASALAEPPAMPGGGNGGQPPQMPSGGPGQGGPGGPGSMGGPGGPGGADTMTFDYTGTYAGALEANGEALSVQGESYAATEADQNALLAIDGGTLEVADCTFEKSGDDSDGDRCNFYGCNSIGLAVNEGSFIAIESSTLNAKSEGSNALFSTDNATILARDVTISTSADNSRGLDATYGGTIFAGGLAIATQGAHCAAVANDRGGGNISLVDSTLATAGSGSPLLYSTGNIQVNGVTGTASGSQIAGMEGLNTILVANSDLVSTITGRTASDPIADGVIIYQSMSGDAEATTGERATFQVVNSSLTSAIAEGAFFYITNTAVDVVLANTAIDYDADAACLFRVSGNDSNGWGSNGSNGAFANVTAIAQELVGDVMADTTSTLNLFLLQGSTWQGSAAIEENAVASTTEAPITVNVGADAAWIVTADSTVSALNVAEGGQVVDADGNAVTVLVDGQAVVAGPSAVSVVAGSYGTAFETTSANELATELIERSAYDERFGTDTAFTMELAI